jgi:competence protein ComEC
VTGYAGLVIALSWSAAIAAAVVLVPSQPLAGVIAAAAAIPFLALALVVRPALLGLALATALLAVARVELPPADAAAEARAAALVGATAAISGHVSDDSRAVGGGGEVLVEPARILVGATDVHGVGNFLVRWRGPSEPAFGDLVVATGKLDLPRNMPDFDRRAYLGQRHVYLEMQATSFDVKASGAGIARLAAWLRAGYTHTVDAAVNPPHAAMLMGIVLGIKHGIPNELEQALIATGLIHLLVLSGLKVAVFARIVRATLVPLLGRSATWPVLGLIGLYCLVGGATPAAVRASAMGALALAATHIGRPTHVWTSLAMTAAAMLGWRPDLAWDVGFQLSFAGTAAIILLTPAISGWLTLLPHVLREPFAVTCAAQVGTLPMMATDFHVLSPVAPVANALTLPVLPVLIGAGFLISVLGFAPDLARLAAIPITGLVAYIEQVGYVLARVPGAAIAMPSFPTWMGLAYYSGLAPAIAGAHASGRARRLAFAGAAAAPVLISIASLAIWANSPPQASVLDVGDGQAVLLRSARGSLLIDGGPSPEKLRDELGRSLPPWQRELDAIAITAPGLGHVGGLAEFALTARVVVIPNPAPLGLAWRSAALEQVTRGAAVHPVGAGQGLDVAGFHVEVLAPEPNVPRDESGAVQLAVRVVSANGRSLCDFSDLDLDAQTVLAARLRSPCSYVLLPSGGRSLLSPELQRIAVDRTTQLIASRGPGRLAEGFPPEVMRTDEEGTITLPL